MCSYKSGTLSPTKISSSQFVNHFTMRFTIVVLLFAALIAMAVSIPLQPGRFHAVIGGVHPKHSLFYEQLAPDPMRCSARVDRLVRTLAVRSSYHFVLVLIIV